MTLDEAIIHAEEVARAVEKQQERHYESNNLFENAYDEEKMKQCEACAEEHRQLAEWLTGYKKIREAVLEDELRGIVHNLENYDPGLFDIRITEQERDGIVKALKAILEG